MVIREAYFYHTFFVPGGRTLASLAHVVNLLAGPIHPSGIHARTLRPFRNSFFSTFSVDCFRFELGYLGRGSSRDRVAMLEAEVWG